jgi:cyclase
MLKTRVIPVVTWDGLTAVQTVQFKNPRSIGSLQQALSVYERRCCDELVVLDIAATPEQRSPNLAAVAGIASEIFCPLTIGGGISHSLQGRDIIKNGADKVVLGRWASPELVYACAQKLGNQSVTVALDAQPLSERGGGKKWAHTLWTRWAHMMENSGAGEIILTSMERQGTRSGYDLELIAKISKAVKIPVIAHGGCGRPEHMVEAIRAGAHAAAAGTMFAFTQWTPKDCARVLNEAGIPARVD